MNADFAATPANEGRTPEGVGLISLEYGITDRITWTLPLILRVALLDDSAKEGDPAQRAAQGWGLAVSGGIAGIGYSSSEAFIVQPLLGVEVSRAVTSRFRIGATTTWLGSHSRLRDHSRAVFRLLGTLQMSERWAVSVRLFDGIELGTLGPSSRWTRHVPGASTGVSCRPGHWLTFGADVWGEAIWRPQTLDPPPSPLDPLPARPTAGRLVLWAGAWVSTHW